MFRRSGTILKVLAYVDFAVSIIATLVMVSLVIEPMGSKYALFLLVQGCFTGFVTACALYAIGATKESVDQLHDRLDTYRTEVRRKESENNPPKQWMCGCGAVNSMIVTNCPTCGANRWKMEER